MSAVYLDRWPPYVETLKRLWSEGLSASQIASVLNKAAGSALFTRNAVIGKLHRMGLTFRDQPAKPAINARVVAPRRRAPPAAKAVKTPPPPKLPPPAFVAPSTAEGMAIGDLQHFHCKHPINEWPKGYGDHARFCGKFAADGPYCPEHTALNSGGKPEPKPKPLQAYDRPRRAA